MKCISCNVEMDGGYFLQLSLGGNIKIVKDDRFSSGACPEVAVCPKCGRIELYVDYNSIKK